MHWWVGHSLCNMYSLSQYKTPDFTPRPFVRLEQFNFVYLSCEHDSISKKKPPFQYKSKRFKTQRRVNAVDTNGNIWQSSRTVINRMCARRGVVSCRYLRSYTKRLKLSAPGCETRSVEKKLIGDRIARRKSKGNLLS